MIEQTKSKDPFEQPVDRYLDHFKAFESALNGESKLPIHQLRREAMERFRNVGFPTTRHEEWRFTNVSSVAKADFRPVIAPEQAGVSSADVARLSYGEGHLLVFVNGHFAKDLSLVRSLPAGVVCGSLAAAFLSRDPLVQKLFGTLAVSADSPFVYLNTAFVRDGAYIAVPDGVVMKESIHVLYIASTEDAALISLRNLIVLGQNAECSIVESYSSLKNGRYLTNAVTEIFASDGSVLEHDKLQNEALGAFHVAMIQARLGRGARCTSNSIALGGSIVRNNVAVLLDDQGGECTLNGLSLGTGDQLLDNHTTIDHAKPNCSSHELYKSILDGTSRGVFNGKIFVRPQAQKTDAKQTNKTLLLSDGATIDTKPQLEIFADDVKCTHGATVGQLDAEQVFYLRTRGIDESAARDILTFAFASDVVRRVHVEPLRIRLEALIRQRLDEGRKQGA